jgi:polar amino acid transport system substrate-binding protein
MSTRARNGASGRVLVLAAVLAVALVATACSNGTTPSGTSGSAAASPSTGVFGATYDPAIASEVPASIRSKGTLTVATDPTYPPMESVQPGTNTIVGADPDLGAAIATVLGLKLSWQNVTFGKILLGLASGQYDLSMSSFTDERSREKTVDFVDYMQIGTSFVVPSDSSQNLTQLSQICGLIVTLESGTTQQSDAEKQSRECVAAGQKPVTILAFPKQTQANLALAAGRAQAMMLDTPPAIYQVQHTNGKFKLGGQYGIAPYGIAIPKNSGLVKPIQDALNKLIADGIYAKILAKWNLPSSAAVEHATVNAAIF